MLDVVHAAVNSVFNQSTSHCDVKVVFNLFRSKYICMICDGDVGSMEFKNEVFINFRY